MEDSARSLISWFPDLTLSDRLAVGGKGANLGELTRAGIPVPPGFVVTTAAFEAFLEANDPKGEIRREISGLDASDLTGIAAAGDSIRRRIRQSHVPADISETISDNFQRLSGSSSGVPVAVRSSATCEDSDDASFAGLQDTYLWVLGETDLVEKVRACWASLYNAESISYRLRLGLVEEQLSIAVVVQQMIDSACAGVMFTRSPTTGDRSVIVIEASWGLGSCIVNGEVTPDRFVVNKVTGDINKRDISKKATEHIPERTTGGVRELKIDDERCNKPCLDDETICRLWEIARKVERHYGCPQDIEWAVPRDSSNADQRVFLLQSRPETVWANREAQPSARPTEKPIDHLVNLMSAGKRQT